MTNAGKNILDDSLISPFQLTRKLEDAIKMLESPKKLLHQQVIFHDQCNSICTLECNLAITYKLHSVHKECRQSSKIPVIFERRHPNIKLAAKYPNHNHLPSLCCNVTIYQLGPSSHFVI